MCTVTTCNAYWEHSWWRPMTSDLYTRSHLQIALSALTHIMCTQHSNVVQMSAGEWVALSDSHNISVLPHPKKHTAHTHFHKLLFIQWHVLHFTFWKNKHTHRLAQGATSGPWLTSPRDNLHPESRQLWPGSSSNLPLNWQGSVPVWGLNSTVSSNNGGLALT